MNTLLQVLEHSDDEKQFGGKAKGLAWLAAQDCNIPAGAVIPVQVFNAQIKQLGLAETVTKMFSGLAAEQPKDNGALTNACSKLQTAIQQAPLPDDLQSELATFWQRHQQAAPNTPLAVRSSAPGEDGQAASFAGQFDSVLNVTDFVQLQQAIRQVWASVFNPHALQYGQHQQCPLSSMAVIIQQQVDAALSGVLFTQHPASGADEMLLEYCEGLGDKLVSGDITPVSVVIGKHTHFNLSSLESLPQNTLTPINQLAQTSQALEKTTGYPLDIEWCINQNHQLYFVQCRPMTQTGQTTPTATELWSNANIAENFPEPVVPLLASFVPRGYAGYFRGLGEAFGIDRTHMDKAQESFNGLVGLQAGRLYYNLSQIFTVIHLVPGGAWLAQSFKLFTGAEGSPTPQQFQRPWHQQLWQAAKIAFHVPRQFLWVKRRGSQFEQMIDIYAAKTRPDTLPQQSTANLARHLTTFLDIREKRWRNAALADTAAMVCYAALKALIKRWLPDGDQAQLHNNLLQGLPGLASARPVEELWELSLHIHYNPKATKLFREKPPGQIMQELPQLVPDIDRALQDYLHQWGFRYSGELMLTQETPAENPEAVIRLLQSYLQDNGDGPRQLSLRRATQREATTEKIAAQLTPARWLRSLPLSRAAIFQRLLRATHGAIRLRERARMKQALLYTRLRHVCLALGERLVQREWLQQRDDIFYLEIDEAIAWATQAAEHAEQNKTVANDTIKELQATITRRRSDMKHYLTLTPPEQMNLPPNVQWQPTIPKDAKQGTTATITSLPPNILSGMSACGGTVSGRAAVMANATQMDKLQQGNILVTRQTDPGWAPVFFLVKGLVIERGGMLSHGAIIAREYGIPAVVGVAQATQLLQDGESLTVDGTQGQVIRHSSQQTRQKTKQPPTGSAA